MDANVHLVRAHDNAEGEGDQVPLPHLRRDHDLAV